jgi:hypothetical protein
METVIMILVTFLVTAGLKSLSTMIGMDLSGSAAAITAALVGLCVTLWSSVIVPMIPAASLPVIEPLSQILLIILSSFGLHKTIKGFQV